MPYYVAPAVQISGPPVDRLRVIPAGSDSQDGANWIWLGSNRAILWLPTAIADAQLTKIADASGENLAAATRAALTALSSDRTYRGTDTFQATVADLLRNAPAGKWNALLPSKARQRYELWLGPGGPGQNLFNSEAALLGPNTQTLADNFNRADGGIDGSTASSGFTWAHPLGIDDSSVVSNQLKMACNAHASSSDRFNCFCSSTPMDTSNNYSQLKFLSANLPLGYYTEGGILCRGTTSGLADFYYFYFATQSNGSGIYANLSGTLLASDTNFVSANDVLRIEADGSSITAKVNGVARHGPVTNTTITSGLYCGFTMYISSPGTFAQYFMADDFAAGDLVAAGTKAPPPFRRSMRFFRRTG